MLTVARSDGFPPNCAFVILNLHVKIALRGGNVSADVGSTGQFLVSY